MLRSDATGPRLVFALGLCLVAGGLAAGLVALGNPGNMGICGACFLRDLGGSLGLISTAGPRIFRPELAGIVLGALVLRAARGTWGARSGSHAVARFVFGALMGAATLVFLGCPFRMIQRLGGGDLNAWIGLPGFVLGVGAGLFLERRGYAVGKTAPAPAPVGLLGPLVFALLLGLFLAGGTLLGPGPSDAAPPPHAPWLAAFLFALAVGAVFSLTGFCVVSAARQVWSGPRRMLQGVAVFIAGYALLSALTGRFALGIEGQPVAHTDALWNFLALALIGITGCLCGGCPVRQLVMTGEGNGDAFVTVAGILLGGALAHDLGIVSTAAGPTPAGRAVVALGIPLALAYMALVARSTRRPAASAP